MDRWSDHQGNFYNCNKFKEGNLSVKKTEDRRALERLFFFFQRFHSHQYSSALESQLSEVVHQRQEDLQRNNRSWIDVQVRVVCLSEFAWECQSEYEIVWVCVCVCVCFFVCLFVGWFVCLCGLFVACVYSMYVCTYVYMHACMYVYICIYICWGNGDSSTKHSFCVIYCCIFFHFHFHFPIFAVSGKLSLYPPSLQSHPLTVSQGCTRNFGRWSFCSEVFICIRLLRQSQPPGVTPVLSLAMTSPLPLSLFLSVSLSLCLSVSFSLLVCFFFLLSFLAHFW